MMYLDYSYGMYVAKNVLMLLEKKYRKYGEEKGKLIKMVCCVFIISGIKKVCCEVTTRSTKVGYLMYLDNNNGLLLVLILSCCKDESMLLVYKFKST